MHEVTDQLIARLRQSGLRITATRRAVCAAIADADSNHVSAADILESVTNTSAVEIDRSTVYRALETLQELGLIEHSHLGHGPALYHLASQASHQHLVCSRCEGSIEIPNTDLVEMAREIRSRTGFTVDAAHFALVGVCADCSSP